MNEQSVWLSKLAYKGQKLDSTTYRQHVDSFVGSDCDTALFPADAGAETVAPGDIILFSKSENGEVENYHIAGKVAVVETDSELVREIDPQESADHSMVFIWGETAWVNLKPDELEEFSIETRSSETREERTDPPATDDASNAESATGIRNFSRPGTLTRLRDIDRSVRASIEQEWGSFWRFVRVRGRGGEGIRKPKNEFNPGRFVDSGLEFITGPCYLGKARYVRASADDPGISSQEIEEVFLDETYTYESFVERVGPDGSVYDGILKRLNQRAKQQNRRIVLVLHDLQTVDIDALFGETLTAFRSEPRYSPRQDVSSFHRQTVTPRLRHSHDEFEYAGRDSFRIVGLFDTLDPDGNRHTVPKSIAERFGETPFQPDEHLVYLFCGLGETDPEEYVQSNDSNDKQYQIWLTEAVKVLNRWLEDEGISETYRIGFDPILRVQQAERAWFDTYLPFVESLVDELDIPNNGPLESCESFDSDATVPKDDRLLSFQRDMYDITGFAPPYIEHMLD